MNLAVKCSLGFDSKVCIAWFSSYKILKSNSFWDVDQVQDFFNRWSFSQFERAIRLSFGLFIKVWTNFFNYLRKWTERKLKNAYPWNIVLKEFLPLVQEYKLVNFSMVIHERSLLLIQECSIQVNTMKSQLAIHIV